MLNKHILIGNLGNDPETIHFDDGNKVTKFSLATNETWKDKQTGEKKTATEWHNIVANRHFSDLCEQYLKKGSKVYIEGKSKSRMYEQDGVKKYITEVHIRELTFLGSSQPQGTPLDSMPPKTPNNQEEDDLPF